MKSRGLATGLTLLVTVAGLLLITSNNIVANGVWHSAHVGGPDACAGFGLPDGCDKNFSLVALQFDDLTVTGQLIDRWYGMKGVHGVVDCLYVEDNFAFVGGTITDGEWTGFNFFAVAADNGKSADDPPDQISATYVLSPEFPFNCEEIPFAFPIVRDDIYDMPKGQVKVK